jgi:hypothetical protein
MALTLTSPQDTLATDVFTVGVGDKFSSAIGQTLGKEREWDNEHCTPQEGGKTSPGNHRVGENGGVA